MKEKLKLADKIRQMTDSARKNLDLAQDKAVKSFFDLQFEDFQNEAERAAQKGLYTIRFFVRRGFHAAVSEVPRHKLVEGFNQILIDNGFKASNILGTDEYIINVNVSWNK